MKRFNVTGLCTPEQDYMADISEKIRKIQAMVDAGEYFTINRARQYGKTTVLQALKNSLSADYIVARISFEGIGGMIFQKNPDFVWDLMNCLVRVFGFHRRIAGIFCNGAAM